MRFAVVLALLVAGCGSSRDRDDRYAFDLKLPDHEADDRATLKKRIDDVMAEALQRVTPATPTPDPIPPLVPKAKPTIDPSCVASGTVTQIKLKGDRVLACVDTSGDAAADACVAWNRATGKFIEVEPVFDVEDDPAVVAPVAVDPEADDPRVTLDADAIQACPEDRVCERFMPLVKDGETIDAVRGDPRHRAVAVSISDTDNKNAHTEVWDLETGRLRARTKITGLDPSVAYTYSLRAYGDAFVSLAKRDDNSQAVVALLGLDGARHPLAGGSPNIVADQIVEPLPGQLALLELGATGKSFTIHVHAVPSGGGVGRYPIPFAADDQTPTLVKMERGSLGVTQWNSGQLRIDVIDLRTNAVRAFKAPGC